MAGSVVERHSLHPKIRRFNHGYSSADQPGPILAFGTPYLTSNCLAASVPSCSNRLSTRCTPSYRVSKGSDESNDVLSIRANARNNNTLDVAVAIPLVSEQFLRILAVAMHPIHHHGFDEENAGIHTSPLNVDVIALIC